MLDLVTVATRCHFCGVPYEREIESEYARLVLEHGICDACCEVQEQARCMEVGDGGS